MVSDKDGQVLDGLEVLRLEDIGLGRRVGDEVLDSDFADVRVGMGDEAHELVESATEHQGGPWTLAVRRVWPLTSSSSVGIASPSVLRWDSNDRQLIRVGEMLGEATRKFYSSSQPQWRGNFTVGSRR